jgi:hypothetical protein
VAAKTPRAIPCLELLDHGNVLIGPLLYDFRAFDVVIALEEKEHALDEIHKLTSEPCGGKRPERYSREWHLAGLLAAPGSSCRIQHEHRTQSTSSIGMKGHHDYLERGRRRAPCSFFSSRKMPFFLSSLRSRLARTADDERAKILPSLLLLKTSEDP